MSSNHADNAIEVRNLSKVYRIAHDGMRRPTFRDVVMDRIRNPFKRTPYEDFWALNDVSFDVPRGEVMGVIGRNGAGKSTLLKILSRVTEPTKGAIDLYGRVGSLLEVGTGFHPELTGRENIYLNGSMLGMRRKEIARQFDAIVAFAEVEKFLDTPVKRYSSGMYVRLAFAVAAHLNPEILVVDEVLAVGDAEFQKKCLGKMNEVASGGRTVLFVSHNMAAVEGLCDRACLLSRGRLAMLGTTEEIIRAYMAEGSGGSGTKGSFQYRNRGDRVSIESVEMLDEDGAPARCVHAGAQCTFRLRYRAIDPAAIGAPLSVSLMLFANGQKLVNLWTNCTSGQATIAEEGFLDCTIPRWPFRSHRIRADVYSHVGPDAQDWIEEALLFDSYDGDYYGSGVITNADQGVMFLDHEWSGDHAV